MLTVAGCEKIFEDKISGLKESRPEWDRLLEFLRLGDTVLVAELSRMTRSLMHLLFKFIKSEIFSQATFDQFKTGQSFRRTSSL
jgi:DNA invertase Pin-like site-specific DNA recombinase